MNPSVIKDWLELPDEILLPFEEAVHPEFQALAVPCLWNLRTR